MSCGSATRSSWLQVMRRSLILVAALAWHGAALQLPRSHARLGPVVGPSRSSRGRVFRAVQEDKEVEGLPWWWEYFWKLPFTQRGAANEPLKLGDAMHIFRTNIEQIYGGFPSVDGTPLAEGDLSGLTDGTMYLGLYKYEKDFGKAYKLCFGPKSFIVISEPHAARHILRDNARAYDKGVLAEILEDIMGKGLIPADPETWKVRRRAIVPAFHKSWLEAMVGMFGECTERLIADLDQAADGRQIRDIEERFGSLALDIIGRAVFNYDFKSVESTSPVVKAAIETLREAEHRSMTPAPYWKIPGADRVVPRQVAFRNNMDLLNSELNRCIQTALDTKNEGDVEELERRDYSKMENPSLLRFLVDMRGEDSTTTQLRDDLITMLIAGHETTASALTWALFELAQDPPLLEKVRAEVDQVVGDRRPTLEDMPALELVRLSIAESLRMYPEPPLLIRRAIEEDEIPAVGLPAPVKLLRGSDIFIAVYNLHRSSTYWEEPDKFDPERFLRPFSNPEEAPHWKGFDPKLWEGQLYPNEIASDFAYLPFGGGPRKCVGDQFAMLEATVALAMLVRRFEFKFGGPTPRPEDVGTNTGATIHTRNGLWMSVAQRDRKP
uniref:Cytochrome P450 n=1 Tax=Rhizochromulina marina TaxID=1034831 RepID=A0A7S2RIW3_9STRA